MFIIGLIKKDVFAVSAFCSPFLKDTFFVYAVFSTEPLPVNGTHFKRVRLWFTTTEVG